MKKVIEQLLFQGLWENSLDSMFLIQFRANDFYIAGINHVLEDAIGKPSADVEGMKVKDLLPEPGPVIKQYKACLYLRETVYYEEKGTGPNGKTGYWHTMLVPLEHDGEIYLFGSSRTIDDLKHTERRLQTARDEAEAANAAKTVFLANMSHELRTPLNGIVGSASLLRQQISEPALYEPLDMIIRSADAMNRLVNDILDLSKIDNNSLTIVRTLSDLRATVEDVIHLLYEPAHRKHLKFTYEIDPQLPQCLLADEPRIRQILINLLSNAIKFTEKGEVSLAVSYTVREKNRGHLRIEVNDTGIGIPRQKINQLGTPFYQINPERNREHQGSGIGLSVCMSLVELMDGDFDLDSYPDRGTRITVTIPMSASSQAVSSDQDADVSLPQPFVALIAEDNPTNQLIMRRMLEHFGAQVRLVNNGRNAVEEAMEHDFHLILMDLHMPGMDGVAATRMLREAGVTTPVVAVTAAVTESEQAACKEAGMRGFIDKPVKIQSVAKVLASLFPASTAAG